MNVKRGGQRRFRKVVRTYGLGADQAGKAFGQSHRDSRSILLGHEHGGTVLLTDDVHVFVCDR